ncbi:pentatricopeptide repeat-containing protein At4g18520, chloroplastic-like isoform X2 [Macadamia integrifolia]|uniref:pentatricopeptide repeat-containing protein At4g18520, chloroplastic-like isoform X2 n=1 Tax=Macadamia integrifolia TaxID=60698 RepID=UPI001C4F36CD|nr:pentatricopeptide repeat-containing protein At4g18520, chloroplastic-like isoform X2 [Macadamia integrifolia]
MVTQTIWKPSHLLSSQFRPHLTSSCAGRIQGPNLLCEPLKLQQFFLTAVISDTSAVLDGCTRDSLSVCDPSDHADTRENCTKLSGESADRKDAPECFDDDIMNMVCDKLIEVFIVEKPTPTDWRRLIAFSKEWSNIWPHFYRRCQERADDESDLAMKHKLLWLRRKLKEVKDILYRLCMTTRGNLQRLMLQEIRILKYLLTIKDPKEQLFFLKEAKSHSYSGKDSIFSTQSWIFPCSSNSRENPNADLFDSLFIDPAVLGYWLQLCHTVKEVRTVHGIVAKYLKSSVTFVDNNLITAYARFGKLLEARKVFDRMLERNVVSWTAILSGYLRNGLDDEVLFLFSELIKNGVKANSKTYVCILNLCRRRSDFELGTQIHACILKGNWNNLIVDSAIVYYYAQCGDLSGAFRAFDRMLERDVVCWTAMITACAQQGRAKEAFKLFSKMQDGGLIPNEFTVCAVLKACGEVRELKFGRQLHGTIVKNMFKDDVYIGTSLMGMYAKCGEILDSRRVFDKMRKRNTVTWTSMISGYALNGYGKEAISLFCLMKRRHIIANNLTVISILRACGSISSLSTGKEVHAQVLRNSMHGNIYIGSTLVWFYCRCGEYFYASKVLQSMTVRDVVSWTAIISGCARLGHGLEALEFFKNMLWEGVEPNPFTYSSALKACARLEAILQGKWIHSSVNKTHALSNVFVGSALIDMYSKCRSISEATKVFYNMPDRNLVSWRAMILGYARNGLGVEALKLMHRMQAEGLLVDDYVIAIVLSACGDVKWNKEGLSQCCLQSNLSYSLPEDKL